MMNVTVIANHYEEARAGQRKKYFHGKRIEKIKSFLTNQSAVFSMKTAYD